MEGPVHAACWPVQLPLSMDGLAEDRLQHQIRDIADSSTPVIVSITEDGLLLLHKAACVDKVVPVQLQLRLDVGLSKVEDESDAQQNAKATVVGRRPGTPGPLPSQQQVATSIGLSRGGSSSSSRLFSLASAPSAAKPPAKLDALSDWIKSDHEEQKAKRAAARLAAKVAGESALSSRLAARCARAQQEAKQAERAEEVDRAAAKLMARCERATAKAGLEMDGSVALGSAFAPAAEVAAMASRLRSISFEARKLDDGKGRDVERKAVTLSHRATTLSRVLARSEALEKKWRERMVAEEAAARAKEATEAEARAEARKFAAEAELIAMSAEGGKEGKAPFTVGVSTSAAVSRIGPSPSPLSSLSGAIDAAMKSGEISPGEISPGKLSRPIAEQVEKAYRMSKRFKPTPSSAGSADPVTANGDKAGGEQGDKASGGGEAGEPVAASSNGTKHDAAKSARDANRTTYWNALGGLMIEPVAYKLALAELPRTIPMPPESSAAICGSLQPVLEKLNRGVDPKSIDYEAAKNAYASWPDASWLDPRAQTSEGGRVRPKPTKGWTPEQYSLPGFAGMYARSLHIARVATLRQVVLWLLETAPGLPSDGPISFGDLGAGTCAACLGARYAVRDYSGGENHPFRVWPIDVGSSSARFAEAFSAMTEVGSAPRYSAGGFVKEVLLPDQSPSQYLTEAQPGVEHLMTSMLRQIADKGERQPHVVIASFSLHYLKREQRKHFFELFRRSVTRPLLLLIVKGVDSVARHRTEPMISHASVPSVFLGIHYFLGRDPKPRVIEAHLALIQPEGEEPFAEYDLTEGDGISYDRDDPDGWVLSTFAAARRRSEKHGLLQGTTELPEEKLAAASWT